MLRRLIYSFQFDKSTGVILELKCLRKIPLLALISPIFCYFDDSETRPNVSFQKRADRVPVNMLLCARTLHGSRVKKIP